MYFFEELEIGRRREVGSFTFTAEAIKKFARQFDPQRFHLDEEEAARGEQVAVWGPSPGFRELRWIKPVLAGDTVSFASEIESLRTSDSRPEWGILQARNTGTNQRGELVFSFLATAFVPRRNPNR